MRLTGGADDREFSCRKLSYLLKGPKGGPNSEN
jgi:hypothetical protein